MSEIGQTYTADVLVIGSGAAGMMAARAASDAGATVLLVDKSIVGRGGATILAQMTVAVALGDAEPDHPDIHFEDTMEGGRGLSDPDIVRAIVDRGPEVILEVEGYGVHWAKTPDGKHSQVVAPGHSRRRCVYVDILNTGGATSAGLRRATFHDPNIRRLKNVMLTRLAKVDDRVVGAVGFQLDPLQPVAISARAVILATGGLTEMYERNSATANMTGDGFMLAAEAGAELRDMEMVQFFPIAHLWPPLIGVDPIMWDPFRYKLGGRLLNGEGDEFMQRYAGEVAGKYTATRDTTTYAIFEEVAAGRGSPHGGAYLDFRMVPEPKLREAFGPVIGILERQGIDLTRDMVEVAPMAHFMIGGVRVAPTMETTVDGLFACGELIQGMHGANRLSGNAITEALVTGRIAGEEASKCRGGWPSEETAVEREREAEWARLQNLWHPHPTASDEASMSAHKRALQHILWTLAGPLRTEAQLQAGLGQLAQLADQVAQTSLAPQSAYPLQYVERAELDNMLKLGQVIIQSALLRRESRGCHQRLDFPESDATAKNSRAWFRPDGRWEVTLETR
ncbi:MAG: FAD-binding protein [Alicyclobacillus sp.]|nr:FAD-binding protein [Alicyclobacillus sp.]